MSNATDSDTCRSNSISNDSDTCRSNCNTNDSDKWRSNSNSLIVTHVGQIVIL